MYDFLTDLDEYFCETYANYDKICILPDYKMPTMHASRIDQYGRSYAYTLPSNTMRLATQEKKAELLATLKTKLIDLTPSFSFRAVGLWWRLESRLAHNGFLKLFKGIISKYGVREEEIGANLSIDEKIWKGICKGKFLPSKNLLFSIALVAQISIDDTALLLGACSEQFDYTVQKDVVVSYLLQKKVYNRGMIEAALGEYKISNLFLA